MNWAKSEALKRIQSRRRRIGAKRRPRAVAIPVNITDIQVPPYADR